MLSSLHIENMAVIRRIDIEPCSGFTAMTGETGAGKSIIIDSINFLLCNKVSRDLIRTGEEKASVTAVFTSLGETECGALKELGIETDGNEICIQRTATADGRSTCRIDGRAVSQQILRSAGQLLVSIHGQNETQRLGDLRTRLGIIDSLAENDDLLDGYSAVYDRWCAVKSKLDELRRSESEKNQLRDLLEYQIKDIKSYKLKTGEEEALLEEQKRLQSIERIKKQSDVALRALYQNEKGITASYFTERAADALMKLSDVIPEYGALSDRLRACKYELDDIAAEVAARVETDTGGEDPSRRLDKIGSRLESIKKLRKKYAPTVDEIISFCENAERKLAEINNSDDLTVELTEKEEKLRADLCLCADKLTESRRNASAGIEREISETLKYLDMPKVRFAVSVQKTEKFRSDGQDSVDFLIATNPGEPMQPIEKVASGGELSRVMLAVKCAAAGAEGIGTIIFDEVDTGISGKTSRKVGIKLKEASRSAQVICVTHSAQIASLAQMHLFVSKQEREGRNETVVTVLDEQGRINETARIIGGIDVTEAQRKAAMDMINEAEEY
ncbi:MAG: DNA repair protein RecN [Clostridia bacterium]|nr:DNA repair protein RecN [Clostridia bacterium]